MTGTTRTRTRCARTAVPDRQARWTRLGITMGHTNTEAKRARIRATIDAMHWADPDQLHELLHAAPVRFHVASLFYARPWALAAAAVTELPDEAVLFADTTESRQRLIGLRSVTGERYVLIDLGYEVIDVLHETPATPAVSR
jgi:hypothetical protein